MTKKTVNPVQRNKRMKHVDPTEDQSEEETFEVVNNPPDKNAEEVEEEDEPKDNKKKKSPTQKQAQQKGGLNWAAIAILCMFALPLLLGGFMQVSAEHFNLLLFSQYFSSSWISSTLKQQLIEKSESES